MRLLRPFSLLFATALLPLGQSAQAARRDSAGVPTILMLGDSLTDGYGLSRSQAYPALVAEKMRAAGYKFEVINAGVSGDTTGGGLRRIGKYASQKVRSEEHTSELQSRQYLVCRLLLEKKKK